MTATPLMIAAALYVWTAFGYLWRGDVWMFVAFMAYAVANIAFTTRN